MIIAFKTFIFNMIKNKSNYLLNTPHQGLFVKRWKRFAKKQVQGKGRNGDKKREQEKLGTELGRKATGKATSGHTKLYFKENFNWNNIKKPEISIKQEVWSN